jgi:hypothetical protein
MALHAPRALLNQIAGFCIAVVRKIRVVPDTAEFGGSKFRTYKYSSAISSIVLNDTSEDKSNLHLQQLEYLRHAHDGPTRVSPISASTGDS